jgi:peptidyl-prolyl cis-trans isomerase SurA
MTQALPPLRTVLFALALSVTASGWAQSPRPRNGDYILAVVNQELVTAVELERRMERAQADARRAGATLPGEVELRRQLLDGLIEERVIVTHARDSGAKVDEADLDRAVQSVAAQNQLSVYALRDRLRIEGVDYARFRANLRDQMLVERTREREVQQRIRITDLDVDRMVDRQRAQAQSDSELNIAQILISLPEGADLAAAAARKQLADAAFERVRRGEDFAAVARQVSEDSQREKGGEIGMRPASRLPDLFVDAVRTLAPGEVAPQLVRSGAGFHVLKLLERREGAALRVTQTRARHILLRITPQAGEAAAVQRLQLYRRQIEGGEKTFDELARAHSDDGTAPQGGDLGWAGPGMFVPEFEAAMNRLPVGGLSAPVVSRFGVHLIQVVERRDTQMDNRQLREQARAALREQRFEEAYAEWAKELRARAYVELREAPL